MFVDIDDLRAELRALVREAVEELNTDDDPYLALVAHHYGELEGYQKVEQILDEMEEDYRKQGLDQIKSLREEENEE